LGVLFKNVTDLASLLGPHANAEQLPPVITIFVYFAYTLSLPCLEITSSQYRTMTSDIYQPK
jgi:hypothetical protein